MDQEVSRGTWLGSSLLMLVASIAVAVVIYGLARSVSLGYIDSMAKVLLDTNYGELVELDGTITPLTKSAIVGLVERNGKATTKVTIVNKAGASIPIPSGSIELTPLNVLNAITAQGEYTNYNTLVDLNHDLGTFEITVYIGR